MNTPTTTSPRPQRRRCALRSWGVSRGLPAPGEAPRVCRSLGSATLAGLFWRRHRVAPDGGKPEARRPRSEVRRGAIRLGRGCWRANLVHSASEASLITLCAGRVQRACPLARAWAGVRPRKKRGGCRVANPAGSRAEPGRRRVRAGRATGAGAGAYAARRSGRKGAVTSSNQGCWRMVRARRSMRA